MYKISHLLWSIISNFLLEHVVHLVDYVNLLVEDYLCQCSVGPGAVHGSLEGGDRPNGKGHRRRRGAWTVRRQCQ